METVIQNHVFFDRVREHTAPSVNDRIDLLTQARIDHIVGQGREAIERRVVELDHEWDIDRALMLTFTMLGGSTFAAGLSWKRGFLYLFTLQMAFLGLHAAQGWCPPVALFRRMNFRTRTEIEAEKHELLSLLREAEYERSEAMTSRRVA